MKTLLMFTTLFFTQNALASTTKLYCLQHEWVDIIGKQKESFYCADVLNNKRVVVRKKFQKRLAAYIKKDATPKNNNRRRSQQLFACYTHGKESTGAIFLRADGTGVKGVMHDNGPDYFKNGRARYRANGKMGFIDKNGTITIPAQFEFVTPFRDGYARICRGCIEEKEGEHTKMTAGKWSFIDMRGQPRLPPHVTPMSIDLTVYEAVAKQSAKIKWDSITNTEFTRKAYKQLCDHGNPERCDDYQLFLAELVLAQSYWKNYDIVFDALSMSSMTDFVGLPDDLSTFVLPKLRSACAKKRLRVCQVLGLLEFMIDHEKEALSIITNACQKKTPHACSNLGYIHDLDFRYDKAKKAYQQGCESQEPIACYNLATHFLRENKPKQTRVAMKKACQASYKPACQWLQGPGKQVDDPTIKEHEGH